MVSAFIIGTTPHIIECFHRACLGVRGLSLPHVLDEIPPIHQLARLLASHGPAVVFVELDAEGLGYRAAVDIKTSYPGVRLIGFTDRPVEDVRPEAADYDFFDILGLPFEEKRTMVSIQRALKTPQNRSCPIVAFQPATGGAGASTTAVNVAAVLASNLHQKVLLVDTDLRSSPLPFWFKTAGSGSVVDAIESCNAMTDPIWNKLVENYRGVDVLIAPRQRATIRFTSWDFMRLLSFAALRYDTIVVDLPEAMAPEFEPVMERADRKFIVCNPERVSLAMARRRADEMFEAGAVAESVQIILNKSLGTKIGPTEITQALKLPVAAELMHDGRGSVERSLFDMLSTRRARLVKGYRQLAESISKGRSGPVRRGAAAHVAV